MCVTLFSNCHRKNVTKCHMCGSVSHCFIYFNEIKHLIMTLLFLVVLVSLLMNVTTVSTVVSST